MSKFFREEQLTNTTESLVLLLPSWEVQEGRSPGRNEREPGVPVTFLMKFQMSFILLTIFDVLRVNMRFFADSSLIFVDESKNIRDSNP
jgi:hypothetical protein